MPTYQYSCAKCGDNISQVVAISEESKTPKCLKCNEYMFRIFSAPSLTFKGSGWGSDR